MRRMIIPLLLVLGASSLASCGKGGYATSEAHVASTASKKTSPNGSGGSPSTPTSPPSGGSPSHAHALAFAQAVNLTAADVPGFSPSAKADHSSAHEKQLERDMTKCAGTAGVGEAGIGGAHKSLAAESSKQYELKHGILDFSVSSEVSVQSSAAEARHALQAIRSSHVRDCFSHYLQQVFKSERLKGAKAGPVSIQAGIPPAPGTAGGFGWRVTASFIVRTIKVPIYLDFLGFVDGPSEVTLLSTGLIRPFPAEVQQRLFALLLARAKQHAL
ncbi:MAG TPA: hypothetical protein VGF47_11315 [Solirubrobacteraceae bacterium]